MNLVFTGYTELFIPRAYSFSDNTDLGLNNSEYPAQPHPIIVKYVYLIIFLVLQINRCPAVVQFVTGQEHIDCLPGKIDIGFSDDVTCNYPSAGTCGLNMFLPIKHETMETFAANMDKAFECELFGFPCY